MDGAAAPAYPWLVRDRLVAQVRRTISYNRQPRKLAALPFFLGTTAVGAYGLWTGGSVRLLDVIIGLMAAGTLIDVIWWLVLKARRPDSHIPF